MRAVSSARGLGDRRSAARRHHGVRPRPLARLLLGKLGLELRIRRLYTEREIAEIVAIPEATAWDIAFLRIPGSDTEIELLEYKGCERRSARAEPCDYGSGHFALHVTTSRRSTRISSSAASSSARPAPVEQVTGPRAGGKSLYAHDPDGYIIEFSQRPPA